MLYNSGMRLRNVPEAKSIVENSPYVIAEPYGRRGRWKSFSEKPLYLEIGMGKGRFIMEMAKRYPEREFIGIERYESVLYKACEKMAGKPDRNPASLAIEAEEREGRQMRQPADSDPDCSEAAAGASVDADSGCIGMPSEDGSPETFVPPDNLHFLSVDARVLPEIFAPGEVDGIYLNFSDPWPKARHAKRRLTSRQFLATYEKYLKDGGILEFKTDNRSLFDFSVEEFREAENWEILQITYDLHNDPDMGEGNVMTEYEKKFSALGNRINKLIAVYHENFRKEM